MRFLRLVGLAGVHLAMLVVASSAQPQPQSPNARNLVLAHSAYGILERCYVGSTRAIARDELDEFGAVLEHVVSDAKEREQKLDTDLIAIDAARVSNPASRAADPAPWSCENARIALSQAAYARFDKQAYARADEIIRRARCDGGPCMSAIYQALDTYGLIVIKGRYCRANLDFCETHGAAK